MFDATQAIGKLWLWQFFTYSFVQFVDIWFMFWFLFGAYTLYQIGNELEREIGTIRFLALYFASAAYGAMAHALYQVLSGSTAHAISFFGPVFAIVAAYAWRYPSRPVLFFFILPVKLRTSVLISGGILLFYCLVYFQAGLSPVSILGAAIAAVAITKMEPWLDRKIDAWESRGDRKRMIEGIELRSKVDQILEKISHDGMGALTRSERKLLKNASEQMGHERGAPHDYEIVDQRERPRASLPHPLRFCRSSRRRSLSLLRPPLGRIEV
jgi:membrane associated rhomboid family serine protease